MNDIDLRTALHRDADLVGPPSPDLLDQLAQRRQHQRRQRAGVFTVVLGVAVLGAGIPLGSSFINRADGGTAGNPAPPSITTDAPPPAAPTTAVAPPTPIEEPVPPTEAVDPVTCPDPATLESALPADTAAEWYTMVDGEQPVCSGDWAAAAYTQHFPEWENGEAGLFRSVDGTWTLLDRSARCGDADIPAAVRERACNVD